MGAKTWMLAFCDGDPKEILADNPKIKREKTDALVRKFFPKHKISYLEDCSLEFTCPDSREVVAGCFPGLTIIAAVEFGVDRPSLFKNGYLGVVNAEKTYLFAMHSVVDWFAFAIWSASHLERSLSVSGESGEVLEDIGKKLPFEIPFWNGEFPAIDPQDQDDADESQYPLVFHPLEYGDATLSNLLGFSLEGPVSSNVVDPANITLMRFKRKKPFLGLF